MDLRHYLSLALKRSWLVIVIVAAAVAVTFFLTRTIPPTYRTSTSILVGRFDQSVDANANSYYTGLQIAESHALLVKQQPLLETVAAETNYPGGWQNLFFTVSANTTGGQVVEISVVDGDPVRAKNVADKVAEQLIKQSPINAAQQRTAAQRTFIEEQLTQVKTRIEKAERAEAALAARVELENDPATLEALTSQLERAQTRLESLQKTFAELSGLVSQQSEGYLSILAPAQIPTRPISPNIPFYLLVAGFVSALVAVALIFGIEYLDETIKNANDVEKELRLTTLGGIGRFARISKRQDEVITLSQPRSPIAEAYRVLRTNLRFSGIENPGGALLVTSSAPGEGKTTTAANLAVTLAQGGKRVVLVDCDLRRPAIHELFGFSNDIGLTDLFLEDASPLIEQILLPTSVPGLKVLVSGPIPPNPAEVLDSKRMMNLLQQLREQSDMVIIDSPPVMAVADASIIGSRCSGAVLVVDSGKTRTELARRAAATLEQANVKVVGVVLNKLSTRRNAGYYYQNYNYYYSSKKPKSPSGRKVL